MRGERSARLLGLMVALVGAGCATATVQGGDGGPDAAVDGSSGAADLGGGDLAPACVAKTTPCDLVCQDCGPGKKCTVNLGKPTCVTAGKVAIGQACSATSGDDCVAGAVCIGERKSPQLAKCLPYCRVDADCSNGGRCVYPLGTTEFKLCSEAVTGCDAVAQTGCAGALGCYPVTPDAKTGCHETGAGGQGAACSSDYDCQKGFGCFGKSGCLELCAKGGTCPAPLQCGNVAGWTSYGACDY